MNDEDLLVERTGEELIQWLDSGFSGKDFHRIMEHFLQKGNLEGMKLLLKRKRCNPTIYLVGACEVENLNMIKLLLKYGADLNYINTKGYTALYISVKTYNLEIINFLLDCQGLIINVIPHENPRRFHLVPLLTACVRGMCDVFDKLIAKGADVNFINKYGVSCLMKACESGQIYIVDRILELGTDVNNVDNKGYSAFYRACKFGHLPILDRLISFGVDFRWKNKDGENIFHFYHRLKEDIINRLLEIGCNISETDNQGNTPLIKLIKIRLYSKCIECINNGVDVNIVNGEGETALDILLKNPRKRRAYDILLQLIKEKNKKLTYVICYICFIC